MSKSIKVGVVGATGYAGAELVGALAHHPVFHLEIATSTTEAGSRLSDFYPVLRGTSADIVLSSPDELDPAQLEIVFLAVPHTSAMALVPSLIEGGAKVVDLSADFRLKDAASYEEWYKVPHSAPQYLEQAVYALPELKSDAIAQAQLLACPGCYPTASALACMPLLKGGYAMRNAPIIIDAKSGVSGAGRGATATTHFCNADSALAPYKATTHQHTPEIEQTLSTAAGEPVTVTFVPHLVPMKRGLLSTAYIVCGHSLTLEELHAIYADAYADNPFVQVLPTGTMPSTSAVVGTNNAHIGVAFDQRSKVAVVACAIDNLGKGAALQAIQVANIACGLDQTAGLTVIGQVV